MYFKTEKIYGRNVQIALNDRGEFFADLGGVDGDPATSITEPTFAGLIARVRGILHAEATARDAAARPFDVQALDVAGDRWLPAMSRQITLEGAAQFLRDVRDERAWSGQLRIVDRRSGAVLDVQTFEAHAPAPGRDPFGEPQEVQ